MNSIIATRHPVTQQSARPVSPLLYPVLLIAGISVIIFSLLGIAVMTGLLPQAQSQPAVTAAATGHAVVDSAVARDGPKKAAAAKPAAQRSSDVKTAAARCEDCGVVESVRAVEVRGQGSGAGAGAYAGNEIEKNMKRNVSYEIRVRMDDHSIRTFRSSQPEVGVGQRVSVRDGRLVVAG